MSFEEDEKLVLKPSTELIPDEYKNSVGSESVHLFLCVEESGEPFKMCMKNLGINIPKENIHPLDDDKTVIGTLKKIRDNSENKSKLILLIWGKSMEDGKFLLKDKTSISFQDIWIKFTASLCPGLKDKPKIFIFNTIHPPSKNTTDGMQYSKESPAAYDIPNEADMLLIFKYNDDFRGSKKFIESLCLQIGELGKSEDLFTLVSTTDNGDSPQPIIISTMLKKIYLVENVLRGHYLSLEEYQENITNEIKQLNTQLEKKIEKKMKPKSSFKRALNRFGSFRKPKYMASPELPAVDVAENVRKNITRDRFNEKGHTNAATKKTTANQSEKVTKANLPVPRVSITTRQSFDTMGSNSSLNKNEPRRSISTAPPPWRPV